jgi:transcriptional regulator with XRE-family HTH domain
MNTRVREIRSARGLTLAELAKAVGTTPQTIQRLETGRLTMSLDWLTRIANALGLQPSDLLPARVRYLGDLTADGTILSLPDADPVPLLAIEVPGSDPMAVKLVERLGPYDSGTILVADKIDRIEEGKADGRDCLVGTASGQLLFRRLVVGGDGIAAYVPYDQAQPVDRHIVINWIAPVVMAVRYFN